MDKFLKLLGLVVFAPFFVGFAFLLGVLLGPLFGLMAGWLFGMLWPETWLFAHDALHLPIGMTAGEFGAFLGFVSPFFAKITKSKED